MDFSLSDTQRHWQGRVRDFMDREVRPAVAIYEEEMRGIWRQSMAEPENHRES